VGRIVAAVVAASLFAFFVVLLALTPTRLPVTYTIEQLWIANHPGGQSPGSAIARVNITEQAIKAPVVTSALPAGIAMTKDRSEVLVSNRGANTLSVIDANSGQVIKTIAVGRSPAAVAVGVGPGGTQVALVADVLADSVSVIDLATLHVEATVHVGIWPSAIGVVAGGSRGADLAVVADYGDNELSTVDLGSMRVRDTLPIGDLPGAIAVVPGGTNNAGVVAVTEAGSNALTTVDLGTMELKSTFELPSSPTGVSGNGDGTVWVSEGSGLVPVDVLSGAVGAPIAVPSPAESIVVESSGLGAWVGEQDGVVQHVNLRTGQLGAAFPVGGLPQSMVITTGTTSVRPAKG
jgi:YVTN family beta-propeller protein